MQVDRAGNFRCQATEWSVNKSTGGFPQLVARLYLTEWYDQQEQEWVDFSEFQMEITAYWVLYHKIKGTDKVGPGLNHQQVMKVFSWDGRSFATLAGGDYSDLKFQVRIDENTYEGAKVPYQVNWLDEYTTDPNRQLKKLNTEELKALDAEFAGLIKPAPKAVSAKKALPKIPTKITPTASTKYAENMLDETQQVPLESAAVKDSSEPEPPLPETPAQKKAKIAAKSARLRAEVKKAPPVPAHPPVPNQVKSDCTKQLAWEAIVELRDPEYSDEVLKAKWTEAINEIAGENVPYDKITSDQWHAVKEKVLNEVGLF
jgi:hypothetical protein